MTFFLYVEETFLICQYIERIRNFHMKKYVNDLYVDRVQIAFCQQSV